MKNKLFKTTLAATLACTMMLGAVAPVFAEVNETQQATGAQSMETVVEYSQDSSFTVTIPKTITLDSNKTSTYEVNVKGDISSDTKVTVIPDSTFTMSDISKGEGVTDGVKADVTATVTQEKTEWSDREVCVTKTESGDANNDGTTDEGETITTVVGTTEEGSISATDLTAGSWKGTFNFAIALEDIPASE